MVKVWAEKEMRNYVRLQSAGIPAPRPIILRNHVLVMEFLGRDGWCVGRCVAMVTPVPAEKQPLPPKETRA
jgi:serine/threonine-protein kinase RIO1